VGGYDVDRGSLISIWNVRLKIVFSFKERSLVGNVKKSALADVDKRCVRRAKGPTHAILPGT
jgi:hypothetical protein